MTGLSLSDRLRSRGERDCKTGCLEWSGARNRTGYGVIRVEGKTLLVHRVAYDVWCGSPEGLLVLHHCDNPACFEPSHLWVGTHKDNSQDMSEKGRSGGQGVTHCPNGHEYVAGSWYGRVNARTCKQCAKARSRERYRDSK